MKRFIRRIGSALKYAPNLVHGYNFYVNPAKLRLIDRAFELLVPPAHSFADLGGVWRVSAAYTRYAVQKPGIDRGIIVDTDYPLSVRRSLSQLPHVSVYQDDFTRQAVIDRVKPVDLVFFFDVLLHQANPHWDEVLTSWGQAARCFVIFNQQYTKDAHSIRLPDLPLERCLELVPPGRESVYRHVYDHRREIHPAYGRPWADVHNIFQWGISDTDLRLHMRSLGFTEVHYHNHGPFANLKAFENHSFIFSRN